MANHLSTERKITIVSMLSEGCAIRSIERATGTHRDTIVRLLRRVGDHCADLLDSTMQNLTLDWLQVDELWSYVGKKQARLIPGDSPEYGDNYIFWALDGNTKLIPAHRIGKRDEATTHRFIADLAARVPGRLEIYSDGWGPYRTAIPRYFGPRADYMQVIKNFDGSGDENHRPGTANIRSIEHVWIQGSPTADMVTTSHVERVNCTLRQQCKRLNRLTLAFSKSLKSLEAAVNLFVAVYNFNRRHTTLGATPAEAAGLIDRPLPFAALIP